MFFTKAAARMLTRVGVGVFDTGLLSVGRFASGRSCDRSTRSGFT
jgi:hypothetical protein